MAYVASPFAGTKWSGVSVSARPDASVSSTNGASAAPSACEKKYTGSNDPDAASTASPSASSRIVFVAPPSSRTVASAGKQAVVVGSLDEPRRRRSLCFRLPISARSARRGSTSSGSGSTSAASRRCGATTSSAWHRQHGWWFPVVRFTTGSRMPHTAFDFAASGASAVVFADASNRAAPRGHVCTAVAGFAHASSIQSSSSPHRPHASSGVTTAACSRSCRMTSCRCSYRCSAVVVTSVLPSNRRRPGPAIWFP